MSRRPFVRKVSRTRWWLAQPRYVRYMAREISSVFIGVYVVVLIVGLFRLSQGAAAFEAFAAATSGPIGIGFAVLTFGFAVYHTYTWFQVTPKAMPLEIAGKPLPGVLIVAGHWIGFLAVSTTLFWLIGSTL